MILPPYGGDNAQISTSDSCGSGSNNSENDQFGFHHTYEYGSLRTTNYLTSIGGDHAVQPVNREIDFHTGLPSSTTDISSEITTTFVYDTMGRLTWVRPEAPDEGGEVPDE